MMSASNLPILCVIGVFAIVAVGIIIAGFVTRRTSKPGHITSAIRKFADEQMDAGWRIKLIPFKNRWQTNDTGGIVPYLSIGGLFGLLAGCWLIFGLQQRHIMLGWKLAAVSLLVLFLGIYINAAKLKARRKSWAVVSARCVDRELRKVVVDAGDGSSWGWMWRVVCEFNLAGQKHRVTPKINWSDAGYCESHFSSEEKAQHFLEKRIYPSGECKLRVNPNDPLDTELLG